MKNSGLRKKEDNVGWLDSVPEQWVVTRNKDIFKERGSLSKSGDETLLTVSHITGVTPRTEKKVTMFMAESMEGYKHCEKGDLVVNTMWAWMGALGTAKEDGICSPAYGVYAPHKGMPYDHRYFDYLYRTPQAIAEMTRNSKGIVSSRLRLYPKDFFQIKTALPTQKEQAEISNYIDLKSKIINRKVELLEKKKNSYAELRNSIISETVFKGVNKEAPMKDSEIDWIGKTPAHWDVNRVKEVFEVSRGRVIAKTELADDGVYPVYSSQTKNNGCLGHLSTYDYDGEYITWTTDGANAGTVFLRSGKFNCTNICGTLKLKAKKHSLGYLYYVLYICAKHNKRVDTNGAKIMSNEMKFIKICLPPKSEQEEIFSYLNKNVSIIDKISEKIDEEIDSLKLLLTAIITDAVTGKIKASEKGRCE